MSTTNRARSLHEKPCIQTVEVEQVSAPHPTDVVDGLRSRYRIATATASGRRQQWSKADGAVVVQAGIRQSRTWKRGRQQDGGVALPNY